MATFSEFKNTNNAPIARDESRYFNRELSWLAFNSRVLEEALDKTNPLIERLRFLSIFQSNLDEFYMIRVSGLKQQVASGMEVVSRDGLSPREQLKRISAIVRRDSAMALDVLNDHILPQLDAMGVTIRHYADLDADTQRVWDEWYTQNVHPILTPLAVGPTQAFPFISNLSLNLVTRVYAPDGERRLARVKVPSMLPRLLDIHGTRNALAGGQPVVFLPIEELIAANIHTLFPGHRVETPWSFRVTRDADFEIKEDEADDLLTVIQEELQNRRFGRAVRIEVQKGTPDSIRNDLRRGLSLHRNDVYEVSPPLDIVGLRQLLNLDLPEQKYTPYIPPQSLFYQTEDPFSLIKNEDIFLHHPFDSFNTIVDFLQAAAADPDVLAIKQTLYRTSGDSPVVEALEEAVNNGKQVAAIIELKARFDEANNITWARRLEQAGVHVIYGVPGLKVHAKMCLIVRSEDDGLQRYGHISTGNYNPNTARLYTDFGLLTSDPEITADMADLFNSLTGFAQPPGYRDILAAPHFMKTHIIDLICAEGSRAQSGEDTSIIIKCNAITDVDVIEALYSASQAGVQIQLFVRGICCLIPNQPGLSENISVVSILGRFLEHSRAFVFSNGGNPKVFVGSADLMDRNLKRRVEALVPIKSESAKRRILNQILSMYGEDTARARTMQSDGTYRRRIGNDAKDVHEALMKEGITALIR